MTALDSIESAPRWQKSNLTDNLAPAAPADEDRRALERELDALLERVADQSTRTRRAALQKTAARLAAEVQALPKPDAVYAGGVNTGKGSFTGTGANGGRPRLIHLLPRGQVTTPGKPVKSIATDLAISGLTPSARPHGIALGQIGYHGQRASLVMVTITSRPTVLRPAPSGRSIPVAYDWPGRGRLLRAATDVRLWLHLSGNTGGAHCGA